MKDEAKRYFIKEDYTCRKKERYFNDTPLTDEYQDPVYKTALKYFERYQCNSVLDLGCGSGFKLIKYFDDVEKTVGIDLPDTVNWLNKKYPNKNWSSDFNEPKEGYDVLICSDVIEHVLDPDKILDIIEESKPMIIVISTPNRDRGLNQTGPPNNPHHIREWNKDEFASYISSRFNIAEHLEFDKNTQCIVCHLKWRILLR